MFLSKTVHGKPHIAKDINPLSLPPAMSLDNSQIEHLPDLSDKLREYPSKVLAVEIAEWKSLGINQYVVRYVAGRATVSKRDCLIVASSRMEDGSIVGREFPTVDSCADYRVITKL